MLLKLAEFRIRIASDIDGLISDLKQSTKRFGFEEEQSWRSSLPKVSRAFSDKSFDNLHLFFGSNGNLALEYRMPGGGGWADLVLLGQHNKKPSAVVVELKDWITRGDVPGCGEGLMERHGRSEGHPSDQVRGYVEWCQDYHSVDVTGMSSLKWRYQMINRVHRQQWLQATLRDSVTGCDRICPNCSRGLADAAK